MKFYLSEAQSRHLVILGVPLVITLSGVVAFLAGGPTLALAILVVITGALLVLAWLFRPRWWGNTRVQALSLTVLGGLAMAVIADSLWLPTLASIYNRLQSAFPEVLPAISFPVALDMPQRWAVLLTISAVFILLNYIWTRHQILPPTGMAESKVDSPFPEKDYVQLRNEFCQYTLTRLSQYDDDVNWSDVDYTTLEAEVELDRQGGRNPRVVRDLVAAIRRDHTSRAFLLLGDPGSGKSVSLRRLCRELYGEVEDTGVVPVYVNLREWDGPSEPSDSDIAAFIRRHMKRESGRAGGRFLNEWYEAMLDHGRFFFLLDSFDEMPVVLDCDDASPKIKEISRAFSRFFHDIHNCRGVLASRRFRQPRGFRGRRLSIRPFTEAQIRSAMARWLVGQVLDRDKLVRDVFRRPDLVPAIRNPFLADLITHYMIHNHGQLPPNHFAIYDDYIQQRLKQDAKDLEELSVDPKDLIESAATIAWAMYNDPSIGLDVDLSKLRELVKLPNFDALIVALRSTRIARVGGARSQNFSFVHRRFAEFFVVRSILANEREVPLDAIPEDSRWRDCLVVYCGVAPQEKVQPIADYCWSVIEEHSADLEDAEIYKARRAIHSLRFLRDAFISRSDCLVAFQQELSKRILRWIGGADWIAAKLSAEALGLLSLKERSEGVARAFGRESPWIQETALRACRHLRGLETAAQQAIRQYVRILPVPNLLRSYKDLSFSFSLSEDLKFQRWALRLDVIWVIALWTLLLSAVIAAADHFLFLSLIALSMALAVDFLLAFYRKVAGFLRPIYRPGFDTSLRMSMLFVAAASLLGTSSLERVLYSLPANAGAVTLAVLVLVPWELWPNLRNVFARMKRKLWDFLMTTLVAFAIFLGVSVVEQYAGWFVKLVAYVCYLGLVVYCIWLTIGFVRDVWQQTSDLRRLRRLSVSNQVSRPWVYEICSSLKTSSGRLRFLETLRLRNVEVTDEPVRLPSDQPWLDDRVQQSLARLEVVWQGLEE